MGETEERCRLRIKKVFKDENVLNFREYLFNPDILEAIKNGTYGWHGPNGESLGVSDAIRKLQDRGYSPQNPAFVATTAPSVSQTSTSTTRSSRKRRAESDSEDDESDEDELTDENVSPREYNLRPRKKIEKREPEGVRYVEIPPEGLDLDKIQRDEIEAQYAPIAPQTGYDLPYYNGYPPHPSTQDYQHLSALGFQQFGMPPASTGMYYPTNYPQYPHPSEPYFSQQNYPSFQSPIPLDPNGILPTEDELDLEPDYQNSYPDYEDADSHSQLFEL
ncbi:hypothetical protein QR680_007421 [Steinernema hermaphroditum]|uniref:Uncharacterized protein n=1 Tax=Steinernema hermaphroditum TaxID=289476 RepID=A0AA39IEK0_9BILA|nr:hypothetical protein QR680_007421 [Steinernema hermaphroditum]